MNTILFIIIMLIILACVYYNYKREIAKFGNKTSKWTLTYFHRPTCPYCVEFKDDWKQVQKQAKYLGIEVKEVDTSNIQTKKGVPRLSLSHLDENNLLEVDFQHIRSIPRIVQWMRETTV